MICGEKKELAAWHIDKVSEQPVGVCHSCRDAARGDAEIQHLKERLEQAKTNFLDAYKEINTLRTLLLVAKVSMYDNQGDYAYISEAGIKALEDEKLPDNAVIQFRCTVCESLHNEPEDADACCAKNEAGEDATLVSDDDHEDATP
jgi:hypothetical protein